MIDRYLLRYFLAVIDNGNFSKAAAACHVTQPTLSVGIAKLEAHLGKPLFVRTNRRVQLTEAGVRLMNHARRIEGEFAAAEREVGASPDRSLLRLGVLSSTPAEWLRVALNQAGGMREGHGVEIVEGRERELAERLARGRIDLALTLLRDDAGAGGSELLEEGYSLALSARHPLAGSVSIAAEDLSDEPMILRRHCELLAETSRFFVARGVRPPFPARTTSDRRALDYVAAGLGVTIMPDCFTAPGVVRVPLRDFVHRRRLGIINAAHVRADELSHHPLLRSLGRTISPS
jgi:DNA-binding transcriptional LysR family regulator